MRVESKGQSETNDWRPGSALEGPQVKTGQGPADPDPALAEEDAKGPPAQAELDQLPFGESVKILSEAMKAGYKRMAAQEGGVAAKPAGESLDDLLDALKSALDQAGLEKGNQASLTRILGDIRNSMRYQPKGGAGVSSGPNPNLLDLSA